MAQPDPPSIRVAHPGEQHAALELALRPLPPQARSPLLDSFATAPPHPMGPLDGLVVAVEGDRVTGACWAQPSPGRAVALWPPQWLAGAEANATTVEAVMLRHALAAADAAGVPLAQALFEQADDPRVPAVEASGFRSVAVLIYVGRSVKAGDATPPGGPLEFTAYDDRQHERLKRLLRRTYVDSLDCPGIEGVRDLEDVLAGYRATGRFDPQHWLLASRDGVDVGVLLLAEHPDADQTELVYLGLVPEARGKGWGHALLLEAIAAAARIGSDHLMAAVDRDNTPARRLYERCGFAPWAERHVWVRLRGEAGSTA